MARYAIWTYQCSHSFPVFINDIFSDLLDVSVIIYLDNILIYSNNPVDHKKHVREFLCCLRKNGLYACPDKCRFSEDTVKYLSFILSKDGLKMDPSKVQTIQDWPEPCKVKDIQSLLIFTMLHFQLFQHRDSADAPTTVYTMQCTQKNHPKPTEGVGVTVM